AARGIQRTGAAREPDQYARRLVLGALLVPQAALERREARPAGAAGRGDQGRIAPGRGRRGAARRLLPRLALVPADRPAALPARLADPRRARDDRGRLRPALRRAHDRPLARRAPALAALGRRVGDLVTVPRR